MMKKETLRKEIHEGETYKCEQQVHSTTRCGQ